MWKRNWFVSLLACSFTASTLAGDPPPPSITNLTVNGQIKSLEWELYPAAENYEVLGAFRLGLPFNPDTSGVVTGNRWLGTNLVTRRFWQLRVTPMSSNALLTANVLNRLAYGPTPDDLDQVALIGPQAYIDQQLQPQNISNPLDTYVSVRTNAANPPANTNWSLVSVTGVVSSSTLYMYLRGAGDLYLDDVQLRLIQTVITTNNPGTPEQTVTTNVVLGPNVLVNGDFESPLTAPWAVGTNLTLSGTSTAFACSGSASLHMVSTAAGSTLTNAISQVITPSLPNNQRCVLSFAYLPNAYSELLTLRLSGSGTIVSGAQEPEVPRWIYATAVGRATATPSLYIYLSGAGSVYVDDMKLVAGNVPEAGANLLQNGGFETALTGPWTLTADFAGSFIDPTVARSGTQSLKVVATAGGGGGGDSVYQTVAGLQNNQTYALSYWYLPPTANRTLTVRLSGSLLTSVPESTASALKRRLDDASASVDLDGLRAWFCHNAVGSPQQLMEVLSQFLENHFVTYHSKTVDYLDRYYDDFGLMSRLAADTEYREMSRWRQALMNPNCTFYDLLKVSAESAAQIIYLDTVESRGDGARIANENYARELFELYCMGVDNGYDQNDIVAMSRAWTGWTVDIVDPAQVNNPFAPRSTQYGRYPGSGFNAVSNIVGTWSFVFNNTWHGTNRAPILSDWDPSGSTTNPVARGPKLVPDRFGPWAGVPYQLTIPRRTGTNGIQDGYDVIRHLADLVFTAEYISVKLCRLFVHDGFPNPTTTADLPEYAFYDYRAANTNRSAEAELVRQCVSAWMSPGLDGRKGHIRAVLRTIFDSELFRSHAGSRQKVKTPVEFVVSAVRALRAANDNGTFTAFTDGNFSSPLSRMGGMNLFNRSDPDGYPEAGPPWISAGTLAERLRFAQTLCMPVSGRPSDAGNNTADPVALLQKKLTSDKWYNAQAVADFFIGLLFQGEGRGNLSSYRNLAVEFLNTADDGVTSSPLANNTSYDTRVRGMVAMLMATQRFQEQ